MDIEFDNKTQQILNQMLRDHHEPTFIIESPKKPPLFPMDGEFIYSS